MGSRTNVSPSSRKPMERKRHRIFLDSNVILSGLFSGTGAPRLILDLLCLDLPALTGLTGRFNLMEIERNLEKKMPAALPACQKYLPLLKLEVIPLPSREDSGPLSCARGARILPVLASALNGGADYLVTGAKKLLSLISRN